MTRRSRWLVAALWAAALPGCERAVIDVRGYSRPQLRPQPDDPSCEALARATPAATWSPESRFRVDTRLVVTDPSVLGGPFAPPLLLPVASPEVSVRVLSQPAPANEGEGKEVPLCIQLRAGKAEGGWKLAGDVAIDTDMVLLGDEKKLREALRPERAGVVSCIEARADDLPRVRADLQGKGAPTKQVLPTMACTEREAQKEDAALFRGALKATGANGQFVLEPRQPAWPLLEALDRRTWAPVELNETKGAGVVIEVRAGDGAYPVRVALDAAENVVALEVRLAR